MGIVFVRSKSTQLALAVICLAGALSAQTLKITPNTTLARETSNNTSAASNFDTQTNGNTKPLNVSKSATRTLLYSGNTTKVFAHLMGWFGTNSGHMYVGYNSADSTQVHKQISDMKSRGISGAILDWYGSGGMIDTVGAMLRTEAEAQGMQFAIMEDVGSVGSYAKSNNCDSTQKVINDLNYIAAVYEPSSAYLRVNGRPVVFFFGMEAWYVDWARVRQQVAGDPLFVFRNAGAFTNASDDGGFAWINLNRADPLDIGATYLDGFYATALQHPDKLPVGTAYTGFDDRLAAWSGTRVMHRQCGKTWLASFAETAKYYNTTTQLPFSQIATWNDYEEGSEIETGIDNCLTPYAWTTGNTLYWKLQGDGAPETVSYFRIFISTDGTNLMRLKDVSAGTRSLSLASWSLSGSTTYKLYVKAFGKPSIQNRISNMVGYRKGDAAPIARLNLSKYSGTAPLTITASASASTDSDGKVSSSTIDFGDGTVMAGPVASHTYQNFDTYTVRAYVSDNLGATATTSQKVTVKPAIPGVVIQTPSNGSTLSNRFRVTAYASAANPISSTALYVDGNLVLMLHDDRLDTYISVQDGTHTVTVNAWDTTGGVQSKSVSVNLGIGPNSPPIAVLGMSTFTPAVGTSIRACTAQSSDPDGGGVSSVVNFGDGTPPTSGTTTYHTYKLPGAYTVTATVTDGRGAKSSTSTTVWVQ